MVAKAYVQEKSLIGPIKMGRANIKFAVELERQQMGVSAERSFANLAFDRDFPIEFIEKPGQAFIDLLAVDIEC